MKQADIIQAVRDGRAQVPPLVLVTPHVAVWVDALKIDGVRVGVSARTAQQVADLLGLSLTTPEVEDAVALFASVRIPAKTFSPSTHDISSDETEREHSAAVDRAIADAGIPAGSVVSTVGKAWVLTAGYDKHPGKAANYGWHSPDARSKGVTGRAGNVWQPLAWAHNLDHHDYSQTLRLCLHDGTLPGSGGILRLPGVERLAMVVDPPAFGLEGQPPETEQVPAPAGKTFGELCVEVAMAEMKAEPRSSPATIAKYHSIAVRNGKLLGIKTGNHCASAASWCALMACREMNPKPEIPHQPRAAAKELMADAIAGGHWLSRAAVLAGQARVGIGDLAIYDRSVKGRPETAWYGHVDRVTRVLDAAHYEAIGANEYLGAWRVDVNRFDYDRLLGFVSYAQPGSGSPGPVQPVLCPFDGCG